MRSEWAQIGHRSGQLVTCAFSIMASGHRYSESSCAAEAWPHERSRIPQVDAEAGQERR